MEEKTVYVRLAPPSEEYKIIVSGNSSADPALHDRDMVSVLVGFPAQFPELSDAGIVILILLSALVYLKFVSKGK